MIDFSGKRILVIGDIMLDRYVYGRVDRISPEAPVPVLTIEIEESMLGGAGNVLRNLTALGASVTIITVIGTDRWGHKISRLVGEQPNTTPYLLMCPSRPSTVKTRHIAGTQQLCRVDHETAKPIDTKDIVEITKEVRHHLTQCDAVIISDYGKGVVSRGIVEAVISSGKPVIIDPKAHDWGMYSGATVITPNQREYDHAINCEGTILLTCGEHGMILIEQGKESVRIPSVAKEVYDVSGAGDTVVAVLALGLASGLPMLEAAKLANQAAGIVVGKRGTAVVTPQELTCH